MPALIKPRHDLSPMEIDAVEDNLYDYNRRATGHHDGLGLGFVICDETGHTITITTGYS